MRLSVVIPTLNEAAELPTTLQRARAVPEVSEIIVSDGGSRDETESIAVTAGARWVAEAVGRGAQLRVGAALARGDVVLLLHADTWLPVESGEAIHNVFKQSSALAGNPAPVVGGGFHKVFRDGPWLLRSTARWRSAIYFHLTGRFFGDQAIFVLRDVLERAGGVPDAPLMEEFRLCREVRKQGRLALAPATVTTSGRTFSQRGVVRTWWLMWRLQRAWAQGVPESELARRYRE